MNSLVLYLMSNISFRNSKESHLGRSNHILFQTIINGINFINTREYQSKIFRSTQLIIFKCNQGLQRTLIGIYISQSNRDIGHSSCLLNRYSSTNDQVIFNRNLLRLNCFQNAFFSFI